MYLYWGCHDKDPICGVEVDVANGFSPIGAPVVLIDHNIDSYGWEVPGKNNDETFRNGWNEGPAMIKHDGKYYLQYAAPGTQFRTYGDGVYVGDSPLGPWKVIRFRLNRVDLSGVPVMGIRSATATAICGMLQP